jgi:hypothetical protein
MQLFWKQNRYLQNNVRAVRKDDEQRGSETPGLSKGRDENALIDQCEIDSQQTTQSEQVPFYSICMLQNLTRSFTDASVVVRPMNSVTPWRQHKRMM